MRTNNFKVGDRLILKDDWISIFEDMELLKDSAAMQVLGLEYIIMKGVVKDTHGVVIFTVGESFGKIHIEIDKNGFDKYRFDFLPFDLFKKFDYLDVI